MSALPNTPPCFLSLPDLPALPVLSFLPGARLVLCCALLLKPLLRSDRLLRAAGLLYLACGKMCPVVLPVAHATVTLELPRWQSPARFLLGAIMAL